MKLKTVVTAALILSFSIYNSFAINTDPKPLKKQPEPCSKPAPLHLLVGNEAVYYWQVETPSGIAKGVARTEAKAKEMLAMNALGEPTLSAIVEVIQHREK